MRILGGCQAPRLHLRQALPKGSLKRKTEVLELKNGTGIYGNYHGGVDAHSVSLVFIGGDKNKVLTSSYMCKPIFPHFIIKVIDTLNLL